ncbi:tyrosine-type recombinase/integrase [Rhizobium sp. VS19-DR104.2]|uniref:tyrosine-type recombinase/integrase n=1 Tax=unclassified Rhizobium TaxID=2613769 RepID=UPI001CC7925A|nr:MULTISPECIES: site-specific integrase [unclassified Rhizobium]MBZ5760243.1 tyrosine-type recombinase/integrase [Rhizobium sp. VS19-DR96]MBZ5766913.1 tyrosine-type recombinase/integrase [Rhizobium sp. VS19-DR129.2]MBZ5773094.1 tyrosine-type recombinase/integrase [Rhizobium sp. VS19-DRK62.2]MBZ5784078.1 tyrosine-type recombinase/integrase [Rhizobium sp. VS19-DR121]MBZ5802438.1 tyrosine-type recombinase/integrase [Rhizobium sp. VS19-DR181]
MVMVELKGIHTVKAKGRTYYYAWRGGPALAGAPGTPEFMASYNDAVAERRSPDTGKFKSIIVDYKATEFLKLSPSTRRVWAPWLDRITTYFGHLSIVQFNRPEKIRPVIRRWRGQYSDKPRAADTGMQVLSRILSHGVDPMGKVASNPCEGIKHLYTANRADIIWTDEDILQLKTKCSAEVGHAVDLAAHTGLRVGDLVRLSWSHVREDVIILSTGKSSGKREAVIPRYDALNEVLARIPKSSPVILTSSAKTPWTKDGLASSFYTAKVKSKIHERDMHFHDLRGTAATKFYNAGLSIRVIAEIMAWEEDQVDKIIRRYVSRGTATREAIRQLNEARSRTEVVKQPVKPSENSA